MSKAPSPRADALQAMREARYGHLQAKAEPVRTVEPKKLALNVPAVPASKPAKKRRKPK